MAACLLRNTVLRSAFIRSLQKAETLSCYSTATEASVDEFKFKYLDDGNASFQKLLFISFLDSASDLYKSDWKLQGNTNTQLKLLCRASYTGK